MNTELLLIQISEKIDTVMEEMVIQNEFLNKKMRLLDNVFLNTDNSLLNDTEWRTKEDWLIIQAEVARHHLKRLLNIYQIRSLNEYDLVLALASHFEDIGLKDCAIETEKLTRYLDEYLK